MVNKRKEKRKNVKIVQHENFEVCVVWVYVLREYGSVYVCGVNLCVVCGFCVCQASVHCMLCMSVVCVAWECVVCFVSVVCVVCFVLCVLWCIVCECPVLGIHLARYLVDICYMQERTWSCPHEVHCLNSQVLVNSLSVRPICVHSSVLPRCTEGDNAGIKFRGSDGKNILCN